MIDCPVQIRQEEGWIMGLDESPSLERGMSDAASGLFKKLKDQLDELDKFREAVEANTKSAVSLVPSLEENKKRLQDEMKAHREKIEDIKKSISRLENRMTGLGEDIRRKEHQVEEIEDRLAFLSSM